jgi:hypothetical protein
VLEAGLLFFSQNSLTPGRHWIGGAMRGAILRAYKTNGLGAIPYFILIADGQGTHLMFEKIPVLPKVYSTNGCNRQIQFCALILPPLVPLLKQWQPQWRHHSVEGCRGALW